MLVGYLQFYKDGKEFSKLAINITKIESSNDFVIYFDTTIEAVSLDHLIDKLKKKKCEFSNEEDGDDVYYRYSDLLGILENAREIYESKDVSKYIGKEYEVIIDRPIGHKHNGIVYLVNYGFIPGTIGGDREEVDVYVLGEFLPIDKIKCRIIGFVERINDNENKLIAISSNYHKKYDKKQIEALLEFSEKRYDYVIHVPLHEIM